MKTESREINQHNLCYGMLILTIFERQIKKGKVICHRPYVQRFGAWRCFRPFQTLGTDCAEFAFILGPVAFVFGIEA